MKKEGFFVLFSVDHMEGVFKAHSVADIVHLFCSNLFVHVFSSELYSQEDIIALVIVSWKNI